MSKHRTKAQLDADRLRPGRPRKATRVKKSERVMVNLAKDEHERLEAMARKEGLSLPALIMRPWRNKGD